jgi:hypothetical protein
MERPIEPEAGFVLEEDYPSAGAGFFLIAGNVFRTSSPRPVVM